MTTYEPSAADTEVDIAESVVDPVMILAVGGLVAGLVLVTVLASKKK